MPSTEITLPHKWAPRPYQRKLWNFLEAGGKRAIEIAHRRWGKDDLSLHWSACAAMQRPGSYWHLLPQYGQARKAIWTAVNPHSGKRRIDEAFPQAFRENVNEQEMFIRLRNGSTWQVIGSDNYENLVGTPPAGIVFSEWARANPAAWAYLAPILIENDGWSIFITTPVGRNHARQMLDMAQADPSWFAEVSTVADTGAISLEAVEQQRMEYRALYGLDGGDALINQEYFCSFAAAILGSYFGAEIAQAEREGRIRHVAINPDLPVHLSWDLGIADACALWAFQCEPPGDEAPKLRVVDYYEASGHAMKHFADWANERGYRGVDVLPQDGKVRELGTGRTRLESLRLMGRKPRIGIAHSHADGIQAARTTIGQAVFDIGRCEKGLEALRQYQHEWDEEARVFKKTPLHNWASHGADSFRYLALAWRTPIVRVEPEIPPEVRRHEQRFGPTPVARSNADGTVTLMNLEGPMAFAQRQTRRRKQAWR